MKKIYLSIISVFLLALTGCQNLDMNPLTEASSEEWYSNREEFEMALNDLYRPVLWHYEANRLFHSDRFTDDWSQREYVYDLAGGNITSETTWVVDFWQNTYKAITRANTILDNVAKQRGTMNDAILDQYEGEAKFFRACFYSYLIFFWGDVPYYTTYLPIEDAYKLGRTDKNVILKQIYEDFDRAAETLPAKRAEVQRVTKGAAYAFKARTALWMNDYATVATASKNCIDLNVYSLDPDFASLFVDSRHASPEYIFNLPRSKELLGTSVSVKSMIPRNCGGNATAQPSWELFCSFLCTDGLPIDKSPLYDPQNPFKNRDPRLAQTIVEFGTEFLGIIYDPGTATTLNVTTGKSIKNKDSQLVDMYSPWDGLTLKKGVDEGWNDDKATDVDVRLMRYADVLLMYAEAKIELNQIDESVLNAINMIRARAYKTSVTNTSAYPAVTETNQAKLRTILRMERRMELAWENRRFEDLIRWHLADVVLNRPIYGLPQKDGLAANIKNGDYFFPKNIKPIIDESGLVDLKPIYATGKYRICGNRKFNAHQYLLPIPSKDVINVGLGQNDGY